MDRALISLLAGLGGMFGWGTSDFLANHSSERVGHFKTFFWSQMAGLLLVLIAALVFASKLTFTHPWLLALTFITGITYAIGYLFFYRGFEIGNVSVVSAVINSQILLVMAVAYLVYGQRLGPLQVPAIALVLLGITLVSVNLKDLFKGTVSLMVGVKETLVASVIFGLLYWPINEFIVEREDWLIVTLITKATAVATVFVIAKLKNTTLSLPPKLNSITVIIGGVGIFEALGVLSTSFGLRSGDSIIVAPISSALTVVTVGLAMIFLKEKITKPQGVGIALTVTGITLTAL